MGSGSRMLYLTLIVLSNENATCTHILMDVISWFLCSLSHLDKWFWVMLSCLLRSVFTLDRLTDHWESSRMVSYGIFNLAFLARHLLAHLEWIYANGALIHVRNSLSHLWKWGLSVTGTGGLASCFLKHDSAFSHLSVGWCCCLGGTRSAPECSVSQWYVLN